MKRVLKGQKRVKEIVSDQGEGRCVGREKVGREIYEKRK